METSGYIIGLMKYKKNNIKIKRKQLNILLKMFVTVYNRNHSKIQGFDRDN